MRTVFFKIRKNIDQSSNCSQRSWKTVGVMGLNVDQAVRAELGALVCSRNKNQRKWIRKNSRIWFYERNDEEINLCYRASININSS